MCIFYSLIKAYPVEVNPIEVYPVDIYNVGIAAEVSDCNRHKKLLFPKVRTTFFTVHLSIIRLLYRSNIH